LKIKKKIKNSPRKYNLEFIKKSLKIVNDSKRINYPTSSPNSGSVTRSDVGKFSLAFQSLHAQKYALKSFKTALFSKQYCKNEYLDSF